jgi:hypothetical protein
MEDKTITKVESNTPVDMIRLAVMGGADLEKLEKLLALQERYEANQSKKAFVKAMIGFKAEAPKVTKDKNNKQYGSKYTSLDNLVNTVNPVLSKHGLSSSWDIEQNGIIKVSCRIMHELGHSEIASASAPADVSGAKNAIQQIKSTITYLKLVTFESICGLASSETSLDDDGKSAGSELVNETQISKITEYFDNYKIDKNKFLSFMKVAKVEEILAKDYDKAINALNISIKKAVKK